MLIPLCVFSVLLFHPPCPVHCALLCHAVQGMEQLRDTFSESRLYCGGFRAQQVITLLHGQRRVEGSTEVVPGIYIGGHEAAVAEVVTGGMLQVGAGRKCRRCGQKRAARRGQPATAACSHVQRFTHPADPACLSRPPPPPPPPPPLQSDFRFFAGCLAWEPGQLEAEVARSAWHTAACSRTLVLKQCLQLPVPLWRESMCLLGGEYAEAARQQQRNDEGSDSH